MRAVFASLCLLVLAQTAHAATSYALLVGGIGQEPYTKWTDDWLGRFRIYLTQKAGVPDKQIVILSGDKSTTDAILAAVGELGTKMKPEDQFVLVISGHGEVANGTPILAVKGVDLEAPKLAEALAKLPTKNQVILNFSAISGDFLKSLAAPGRVNIAATSPTEIKQPVFPEFFLRGLESGRAGQGQISLLQAYNWAAKQTPLWIARWEKNPESSAWKATGRETVEIFKKLYAGSEVRKLDPASDANRQDEEIVIMPPNGEVTPEWANRRVVDEHAVLEDNGQQIGVSVLTDKGFVLIEGAKEGDPGFLASKTFLGVAK